MKKFNYFILAFLLSILVLTTNFKLEKIDQKLKLYYDHYMSLINSNCPKLNKNQPKQIFIYFSDHKDSIIGLCSKNNYRFIVTIDNKYWSKADEAQKYQLVMHELSHCVLGIDHSSDIGNYMFPVLEDLSMNIVYEQVVQDIKNKCAEQK